MLYDQSESFDAAVVIAPAVYSADNTLASINLGKAGAATLLIAIGVGGITFTTTNKIEFVLTHSDTTDGTFTAVTQDDVVGVTVASGGIVRALTAAHAAASVTKIGYRGRKQFIRLLADFSGSHGTGTPISATVVTGLLDRVNPA